jgi:galactokinase
MGSHTDYNLGFVLTMAISRDTWIAARPNGDRQVRMYAANLDESDCFSLDAVQKSGAKPWSNYLRGVAAVLSAETLPLKGFDAVIHSTVPIASGLSSSAALECATAIVFQQLGGWRIDPRRLAQLCQRSECEFVGMNCGILDQFSSCLGEEGCALLLDCRDLSTRPVPIADDILVVICDTRAPRQLVAGEYAQRRKQCEEGAARLGVRALGDITESDLHQRCGGWPGPVRDRCRFIVSESARVIQIAQALTAGDRAAIGELTRASFEGARDLFATHARDDGCDDGRSRHYRRAAGGSRIRRLHGSAGGPGRFGGIRRGRPRPLPTGDGQRS